MSKTIVFQPYNLFVFYKCLTNRAYKKIQYGYHGENCLVSDHTERQRTSCEIYSSVRDQIIFQVG